MRKKGNEDAVAWAPADAGGLVLALADGAGSAKLAAVGSRLAVDTVIERLGRKGPDGPGATLAETVPAVRSAVAAHARSLRVRPRQLASTLVVAVLTPDELWLLQLGDGAIVIRSDGEWLRGIEPHKGQYAGETLFTTSRRAASATRIESMDAAGIEAVALLSDGLEPVATDIASGEPHQPFFEPLLDFARRDEPAPDLSGRLQGFLESDRLQSRTGDDLSLILACLPPALHAPE